MRLRDDFLTDNYLSDDERHPVSELGTNSARALGTNAVAGHMWGQMSSLGYKQMKEEQVALHDRDVRALQDRIPEKAVRGELSSGQFAQLLLVRGISLEPA